MKRIFILASVLYCTTISFLACSDDESGILPGPPDYMREDKPTEGAYIMTLEGKTGDLFDQVYANMVYVDLGGQKQEKVARVSWHLGFYCGEESHVTLNQSYSRAQSSGKTDFAAVTEEDAKNPDFPNLAAGMTEFSKQNKPIADATDGDLNKTIFGTLSSDTLKSEVFLLATEELDKDKWYKVKVTSQEGGYLVDYGNINDRQAKRVVIKKDPLQQFVGFSLDADSVVNIPQKWHLMWAKAVALTTMPNGNQILGPSSDVITSNRHAGVEVAEVNVSNPANIRLEFEQFSMAGVDTLNFKKEADVVGTDWRVSPMPNVTAPGPRADRFYVFKDAEGKYFKVRFLHFCEKDGGERGKPVMEAAPLN